MVLIHLGDYVVIMNTNKRRELLTQIQWRVRETQEAVYQLQIYTIQYQGN